MVFSPRGFVLPTPDILQSSHLVPVFFFLTYLLAVLGLCCCTEFSPVAASEDYSGCGAWASHCSDFFRCGVWAPGTQASVVVGPGLSCFVARGLSSWLLPGSGAQISSCGTQVGM